jgi:HmuY protein
MNKFATIFLTILVIIIFNSCEKETKSLVTKSENISLGAGYSNDIYYSLSDGFTTSVSRTNWDIAFCVSPQEAAILTNGASGVELKAYPLTWSWSDPVDISDIDNWPLLNNSDTTWLEGAFNMNATGHPNYGWGDYSMTTHNLDGVSLYIVKTINGSSKKIWIENKLSVDQKYTFRYADIDGSNEQVVNLNLAGKNKNFTYYSLDTNQEIDREPETDKWDIVFTKYWDKSINYIVTGALQNIGVTAQESTDIDPLSEVMPSTGYLTDMSTIGADWKSFDMAVRQYSIDETRVFFIKDQNEKIYRIRFTDFEGSSTGNLSFDISKIE